MLLSFLKLHPVDLIGKFKHEWAADLFLRFCPPPLLSHLSFAASHRNGLCLERIWDFFWGGSNRYCSESAARLHWSGDYEFISDVNCSQSYILWHLFPNQNWRASDYQRVRMSRWLSRVYRSFLDIYLALHWSYADWQKRNESRNILTGHGGMPRICLVTGVKFGIFSNVSTQTWTFPCSPQGAIWS